MQLLRLKVAEDLRNSISAVAKELQYLAQRDAILRTFGIVLKKDSSVVAFSLKEKAAEREFSESQRAAKCKPAELTCGFDRSILAITGKLETAKLRLDSPTRTACDSEGCSIVMNRQLREMIQFRSCFKRGIGGKCLPLGSRG